MSEIYGRNPVIEALKSGTEINRITIAKGTRPQATREIYQLARERQIPVAQVERKKLDQLFPGKNHSLLAHLQHYYNQRVNRFTYHCFTN